MPLLEGKSIQENGTIVTRGGGGEERGERRRKRREKRMRRKRKTKEEEKDDDDGDGDDVQLRFLMGKAPATRPDVLKYKSSLTAQLSCV